MAAAVGKFLDKVSVGGLSLPGGAEADLRDVIFVHDDDNDEAFLEGTPGVPDAHDILKRLGGITNVVAMSIGAILVSSVVAILIGRFMARRNTASGKILALAGQEWPIMVPATFALFFSSAALTAFPFLGGQFVQAVGSGKPNAAEELDTLTILIVVMSIITAASSMIRGTLFSLAGERIILKLRNRVFEALLCQEVGYFDTETSGALVSRLASDTGTLQNAASVNLSMFLRTLASMILCLIVMIVTSWKLALLMLAVVPPLIATALILGRVSKSAAKEYQENIAASSSIAADTFGNVRTVRAFYHGEKMLTERYREASQKIYRSGRFKSIIYGLWAGLVFLLFFIAFALVLRYGASLVLRGDLTQGDLISFVLYTINMAASLGVIGSVLPSFMSAIGATLKIFEIIDRVPKIQEGNIDPGTCSGVIEFVDVGFAYPTRTDVVVLKGVSWTANTNGITALVGQSGSGKSSCIGLIQRLYEVTEGSVKIDGYNVKELRHIFLRRNVAVVSQEPVLFAVTAQENILFGVGEDRSSKDVQERLVEAAKLANCHSFISDFPEKYMTLVGERGTQLSGGQKQRVAIARAVIMRPTILMLDEATSALDAESEGIVQDALNKLLELRGRTFIVVAHRLSTVKGADKIIVMEKGSCLEQGKHAELLAKGGAYKELVQRQLEDKIIAAEGQT